MGTPKPQTFWHKKMNILGKQIPLTLILALLFVGGASAALLTYFGQITTTVNVEQGLTVDGHDYTDPIVSSADMTSIEEKNIITRHNFIDSADVDANVDLASSCSATTDGCDDITTTYYILSNDDLIDTADRLLLLQDTDGSWDWDVTGNTNYTGTTYLNIAGVTAQGLLKAYQLTGDTKYLDAAKKAGDYLITQIGSNPSTSQRQNAFSAVFLFNLGTETGNSAYTTQAQSIVVNTLTEENYWTSHNGNNCGTDGCTAEELKDAYLNYRGGDEGIAMWDLSPWVEAANDAGYTSWSNDLKAIMAGTTLDPTGDYYTIGLSGIVKATGDATAIGLLIDEQQTEGYFVNPGFPNEKIQSTAYSIMALNSVGKYEPALKAQIWLASQSNNGVWLEDGTEYSEVDSEAIQSIPMILATNPISVGAGQIVPFAVDHHFPKGMKPDTYTLTTMVTIE